MKPSLPIFKPHQYETIKTHRYQGTCLSLWYNNIYSDLLEMAVKRFPLWLAPNVITLTGFSVLSSTLLYMFYAYGTALEGPISNEMCLMIAFAM